MAQSYKDHPIPELKGEPTCYDTTFLRPTKAVYEKWMTSVRKVLGTLGIYWIIPMALALEFARTLVVSSSVTVSNVPSHFDSPSMP
eukprot:2485279-Rhodomonas_salina.1